MEEENERVEEEMKKKEGKDGEGEGKVLSDEEIDEKVDALRVRLTREFEEEGEGRGKERGGRELGKRGWKEDKGRGKRQFKSYQVHELAEAKIEESERLRRALGIREGFGEGEDEGRGGRDRDGDRRR